MERKECFGGECHCEKENRSGKKELNNDSKEHKTLAFIYEGCKSRNETLYLVIKLSVLKIIGQIYCQLSQLKYKLFLVYQVKTKLQCSKAKVHFEICSKDQNKLLVGDGNSSNHDSQVILLICLEIMIKNLKILSEE